MNISAGNYNPTRLTPRNCAKLCQPNYRYAGLQLGQLCFCGDSYGNYGHDETLQCNLACPGDETKSCGSATHNSIYAVPLQVSSVILSGMTNNSVISRKDVTAFSDTFFALEVEGSGFASVVVEFGDGYIESFSNRSFSHRYLYPGLAHMEATVLDAAQLAPYPTAAYLQIHLPIMDIKRLCPIAVLQGEVFDCEFTTAGTGMRASVDIEGMHSFNLTLADASVLMFGPNLDQTEQPTEPDVPGVFIKLADRVTDDAELVFRPHFINGLQFCYRTLSYIDEAEDCLQQSSLMQHRCLQGEKFSFTKRSCFDTDTKLIVNPDASQPEAITYSEVSRYNFTTDKPGKQFLPLPNEERFELQAGDLVGFQSPGTSVIRRIQPPIASNGDVQIPDSDIISVPPNPPPSSGQFLFRAVAVRPSRLHVRGMYAQNSTLGPRSIKVSVENAVSSQTLATVIYVDNVIDNVSLIVSRLGKNKGVLGLIQYNIIFLNLLLLCISETYETVGLTVDYDGEAFAVEWNMGDGITYNTTENSTTYQWKTNGSYNITVRVLNHYNAQSDTKLITVQERILGLNWTTLDLGTPILLGSQAVLNWTADNGTDMQYVFEFDWNLGRPVTNFTFGSDGAYYVASLTTSDWALQSFTIQLSTDALSGMTTFIPEGQGNLTVSLHVFNLVSDMRIQASVVVQSAISGFNVFHVPPQKFGEDIVLVYELASGSTVIVEMTVDGYQVDGTCVTTDLEGECMLGYLTGYFEDGEYSVELSAYNGISGPAIVVTNITIQVPFSSSNLSVEISPGLVFATGTSLSVVVDMLQGSDVHHLVDFGDGSNHVTGFTSCFLPGCEDEIEVDRVFSIAGVYASQVLTWNLVSSVNYSMEVRVQNPVTILSMDRPTPSDLIGVAKGDSFEIIVDFNIDDYTNGSGTLQPTDATAAYFIPNAFYDNYALGITNNAHYPVTQVLPVPSHGWYVGNVTVFNLVSEVTFQINVNVEEFIESFSIVPTNGFDLLIDEVLHFDLNVSWGSQIDFSVSFGDGTSRLIYSEKRGTQVSHVYAAIGEYQIYAEAWNGLGIVNTSASVRLFGRVTGFFLQAPLLHRLPLVGSFTVEVQLYIKRVAVLANNVTVSINFDDGKPTVVGLTAVNMSRPELDTSTAIHMASFSMTYNETGKFTAAAHIANPASFQNLMVEFWIYKVVSDLQAFLKYNEFSVGNFTSGDPALDQQPFVADGLFIPIDHAVVLVATFASGNGLTFTWDFGETPGLHTITDEPREIYKYNDPGVYNVTLNASNPISHMTTGVTVNVQVPVTDVTLTVLDIGDQTSNVTMYFEVRAVSLGTDACYRVDFQDSQIAPIVYFGSQSVCLETYRTEISYAQYPFVFEPLDMLGNWEENRAPGAFNITNIYDRYGSYAISVTGSNIVSSSFFVLSQYVSKPDCSFPKVSVNKPNLCDNVLFKCAQDTKYRVYLASVQIIINSEVSLNCKSSNKGWYDWSVSFLGNSTGNQGQDYDLPDDIMTAGLSLGSLIIKPASLRYGWYHLELNVSMYQEYPPIAATDSTYIHVVSSPLEVSIYGGDERTVSNNYTITIDAERLTYDPDIPRSSAKPDDFRFVWLCRRKSYYSTNTFNTTYDVEPFEVWDKFYDKLETDGSDNKNGEIDASDRLVGISDREGCFGLSQDGNVPAPGVFQITWDR
ncbi:uncharacterized protein LOC119736779 [Patiria miniata]|uniref:Uncharacterized protein n=1 Tax=Patiria miniata TaxID=46514 RepID=A0A914ATR3_PATMI|nr:uncharacterized protein LOC119736779 [Patiria miniata]